MKTLFYVTVVYVITVLIFWALGSTRSKADTLISNRSEKSVVSIQAPNCYNPVDKTTGKIGEYTCAYVIVYSDGSTSIQEVKTGHM